MAPYTSPPDTAPTWPYLDLDYLEALRWSFDDGYTEGFTYGYQAGLRAAQRSAAARRQTLRHRHRCRESRAA